MGYDPDGRRDHSEHHIKLTSSPAADSVINALTATVSNVPGIDWLKHSFVVVVLLSVVLLIEYHRIYVKGDTGVPKRKAAVVRVRCVRTLKSRSS